MNRIAVVGCCGTGKSTFSQKLAMHTDLPLHHLDTIFWKPGWVHEDLNILDQRLGKLLPGDQWILDGNYTRTASKRFQAADTVFFFDFPCWLCLYRTLKRTFLNYGRLNVGAADGCFERFNLDFVFYILKFKQETRPRIIKALEQDAGHCKVIVFKRPGDVKEWLANYEEQA